MRISHCVAAGLGLALLQSASAGAAPQRARPRVIASHPAPARLHDFSKVLSAAHGRARGASDAEARNDRVLDRMLAQQQKALERLAKAGSKPIAERRTAPATPASEGNPGRPGSDIRRLRQELSAITARLWGTAPPDRAVKPQPQSASVLEPKAVTLKLPDVGRTVPLEPRLPVDPATASVPAVIDERPEDRSGSAVADAVAYLIATATPGDTMIRQGAALAIGRLHPDFSVKLAEAIKRARSAGLVSAGVFSAYRPPAFGVGGFSDKFNSLHSYGLAADITGIGGPGSPSAHLWEAVVEEVGLYLVYGSDNRAEFNHTQLVPDKTAPLDLRLTITPAAPKDLREMWLASGIDDYVTDVTATAASQLAAREPDDAELMPPRRDLSDAGAAPHRAATVPGRVAELESKAIKAPVTIKAPKGGKKPKLSKLSKLSKPAKHAAHGAVARTRVSAGPPHAGARRKAG
jgi:hypothetical protein